MKLMTTSLTAVAAFGILAVANVAANACPGHKNHVSAAVTAPVTDDVVAPATVVDPVQVAEAAQAVLVPASPQGQLPAVDTDQN